MIIINLLALMRMLHKSPLVKLSREESTILNVIGRSGGA